MERRSPTGIARELETSADDGAPYRREWRTPCSIRTALFAALRAAVPTGGRRSRACASLVLNRDCAVRPPAAGCADQRSAFPCLPFAPRPEGERENPPFHTFPRNRRQRTEFAAICLLRARQYTTRAESRWSAGLRPASRGSAKPAPTTLRPANLTAANAYRRSALNRGDGGAPVSDRHRAGARNPPQRRCAPPISRERTTYRRSALNRGDGLGNADLRSAPLGEAQRATYHHPRRIAGTWSAGLRPASRGSAKPAPMTVRRTDTRVWRI